MGEPEQEKRPESPPESRLQPEDLSVSSRPKNSPPPVAPTVQLPTKPPELKLSVRKLLGCTPSPPPVRPSRSPSPEDLRSASPIVRSAPALIASFPLPLATEESIKGELDFLFFCCVELVSFILNWNNERTERCLVASLIWFLNVLSSLELLRVFFIYKLSKFFKSYNHWIQYNTI